MADEFKTPYLVCAKCAHQLTVAGPVDRCENCGAGASWLDYFQHADLADDYSEETLQKITTAEEGRDDDSDQA